LRIRPSRLLPDERDPMFDDFLDDRGTNAPALKFRQDLQLNDVKGVRLRFKPQTTGCATLGFDNREDVLAEPSVEISPLPRLVPAPGVLDDVAHGRAMKRVEEMSFP
jgi:hypothetical protein